MRLERKYLGLVSNPEILIKKSRSRLELRDLEDKILVLVSNLEIERDKILKSERTVFHLLKKFKKTIQTIFQLGRLGVLYFHEFLVENLLCPSCLG